MENSFGTLRELHRRLDGLAEVLERDRLLAARLAVRVHDHAQVLGDGHARDRDRVLEGHEQAGAGALVRIGLRDVLAVEEDLALGDLEVRVAHDALASVDLPEPFGPISAWNSPERTCRSTPLRICLSPAETWRFLISRSAMDLQVSRSGASVGRAANSTSSASVVRCSELDDAHLHARPQQLGGAVLAVGVVRAQHARRRGRRRSSPSARSRPRARARPASIVISSAGRAST